jgi:hypothetical protein
MNIAYYPACKLGHRVVWAKYLENEHVQESLGSLDWAGRLCPEYLGQHHLVEGSERPQTPGLQERLDQQHC